MKNQNEANKKVAVVTGSSSGIGYATALRLAGNGYLTFATMRNPARGAELVKVAEKQNLDLKVEQLDITDPDSVKDALDRIVESAGRIDVLVNNAGYASVGSLEDLSMKEIEDQIDTNLLGTIRVTQQVLPVMRAQKSGVIVNVSSVVGRVTFPFFSAYIATKFAVEGLSESLAHEVAPFGIRVALVEPGVVKTKVWENHVRARRAKSQNSPYYSMLQSFDSSVGSMLDHTSTSDQVAAVIMEAISSPKPKLRYPVGQAAVAMLEKKRELTDEQFAEYIRNSLAGVAPSQR